MEEERLAWQELLCEKDEAICEALDRQPILRRLRSKKKITQAKIDEINNPYTNQSDAARNGALMRFIEESHDTETFEIFCQALKDSRQPYLAKMLEEGLVATNKVEDESGSSTGPSTTGQQKEEASGNEPAGHRLSGQGGDGKDADSGPSGPSALPAYPEALDGVRGNVLIINLRAYHFLQDRLGSPRDVEDVQHTFEELHYNVLSPITDPKVKEIPSIVEEFATKNLKMHCPKEIQLPAIVFVMGHGHNWSERGGEVVLGSEAKPKILPDEDEVAKVEDINKSLCKLHGSPKLIFYQLCRGERKNPSEGSHMKRDGGDADASSPPAVSLPPELKCKEAAKMSRNVLRYQAMEKPEGADLFVGMATSPGKVAHINEHGSPFIYHLCRRIGEYGAGKNRLSLDDIMRKVHKDMQGGVWQLEDKGTTVRSTQVPVKSDSFTEQFFFGRP